MAAIFPPSTNSIARLSISAAFMVVIVGLLTWGFASDSSISTGVGRDFQQPLPFSHKHHVEGLGLDCRFCHVSVEKSSTAGLPDTWTCMGCHSQIWSQETVLEPVRESAAQNKPLAWSRVHNLPDHVFFDHGIHIQKGIGCVSCHGEISRMPSVVQVRPFRMQDCNGCHADPSREVRPRDQVFNESWHPASAQQQQELMRIQDVHPLSVKDCALCHR